MCKSRSPQIPVPFLFGAVVIQSFFLFQIFSPTESSNQNKERVASVIAHELAHQWFGNLMTLDWWNDLWLVFCLVYKQS